MAGELRIDRAGLSALVGDLHVQGTSSADHARAADRALDAAAASATTAALASALDGFAGRFRSRGDQVGARMGQLGTALDATAAAFEDVDGRLAASVREPRE